MDYQILLITLSLVMPVSGHGALAEPKSRGFGKYEGGPTGGLNFVCRNPTAKTPALTLTAGGTTTLKWAFGAAHKGDCALFLSYDHEKSRGEQKYFKIANLPDCNLDNNKNVNINLPIWLPAGQAVMRWDWYALHAYPKVEFYVQCIDVTIVSDSTKTPDEIPSYIIPGQYPNKANQAAGNYWNPYGNTRWKMEGPPCAPGISNNCCDTTGYARTGFINSACATSGTATTAAPTPAAPTSRVTLSPSSAGENPNSECEIYVVKSGDTMTKIAAAYTANGHAITPLELCRFNKDNTVELSACDLIHIDDNLVIPGPSNSTCLRRVGDSSLDNSSVQVVTPSLVFLIILVALCVI